MNAADMKRINGFPNTFWGWGGEDDEFQKRCERTGITWQFPARGTITDLEAMTLGEKIGLLKEHKNWKCNLKWEALEEHEATWSTNGLADLRYSEEGRTDDLHPSGKVTKVTVDLGLNGTHWTNDKSGVDQVG